MKGETMFGWSMFAGVLGAISFLLAGAFFMAHFSARKEGQPKREEKQKPLPRFAICSVICAVSGVIVFVFSYYFFYGHFAGKIGTISWLDPKMIFRVGGQAKIEEQNAVFLGNAAKDVWCVNSESLDPRAQFVRAVKSPDGKWVLKAFDMPQAEK